MQELSILQEQLAQLDREEAEEMEVTENKEIEDKDDRGSRDHKRKGRREKENESRDKHSRDKDRHSPFSSRDRNRSPRRSRRRSGGHLVVESVHQNLDDVESTKVEILQPEPGIEHRIEGILRTEAATIPHQEVTERKNPLTVAGKVLLQEGEKDLIGEVIVIQEAAVKHRTATETGVERGKISERNY